MGDNTFLLTGLLNESQKDEQMIRRVNDDQQRVNDDQRVKRSRKCRWNDMNVSQNRKLQKEAQIYDYEVSSEEWEYQHDVYDQLLPWLQFY